MVWACNTQAESGDRHKANAKARAQVPQQQKQQQQQQSVAAGVGYPDQLDPYEVIRIPLLPDTRTLPPDIQAFRDQCASGVRQAVAMVTAMEHQLWWERSRRQQAEEDCKVLLAAVHSEQAAHEELAAEADQQLSATKAQLGSGKLRLAADELSKASGAATTIQKHYRGMAARKEYEGHLKDILRGIDPELDPDTLPATAQHHLSGVNKSCRQPGMHNRGIRGMPSDNASRGISTGGTDQGDQRHYYQQEVHSIEQRLNAGSTPPSDPMQFDIKGILKGAYPASAAQVVVALVRRCKELQSALLEVSAKLSQAELSNAGLRQANAEVLTLSKIRCELEAEKQRSQQLLATVSRLRNIVTAEAQAAKEPGGGGKDNPHIAAWYRKQYGEAEFEMYPKNRGSVLMMDGPDAPVEMWDDLKASAPEQVLIAKSGPVQQYSHLQHPDLDMHSSPQTGRRDTLYTSQVPDTSRFDYRQDTPIVPMHSPVHMMRESLPPGTYMDVHEQYNAAGYSSYHHREDTYAPVRDMLTAPAPREGFSHPGSTPVVPAYSVLPMIQEGEHTKSLPTDSRPELQYHYPQQCISVAEAALLLPTTYAGAGGGGQLLLCQGSVPPRENGDPQCTQAEEEMRRQRVQKLQEAALDHPSPRSPSTPGRLQTPLQPQQEHQPRRYAAEEGGLYIPHPSESLLSPPPEYNEGWLADPELERFNYEQHTPQVGMRSPLGMLRDMPASDQLPARAHYPQEEHSGAPHPGLDAGFRYDVHTPELKMRSPVAMIQDHASLQSHPQHHSVQPLTQPLAQVSHQLQYQQTDPQQAYHQQQHTQHLQRGQAYRPAAAPQAGQPVLYDAPGAGHTVVTVTPSHGAGQGTLPA